MCGTCGVHLVGSVAMKDAESVFRAVAAELGPWLKRIPDGETGKRYHWILWQREMLLNHPAMEIDRDAPLLVIKQWDGAVVRNTELLRFKAGIDPSTVMFETGYAPAAIESYATFSTLRSKSVIPPNARFQVSLPTPMASANMYVSPAAHAAYLPAYERSLIAALDEILAAIPHRDLSIQWDVCQEVLIFENYFPQRPSGYKTQVFEELARLGNAVPSDVELGYHLCYGSPKDAHLVMPKDTAIMVEILNGVLPRLNRKVDFVHLPVPRDRTDDGYFAPLAALALGKDTEVYLGLLHYDDHANDVRRAAAARKVLARFGVATECGWGRTEPERVPGLISAHRRFMEEAH